MLEHHWWPHACGWAQLHKFANQNCIYKTKCYKYYLVFDVIGIKHTYCFAYKINYYDAGRLTLGICTHITQGTCLMTEYLKIVIFSNHCKNNYSQFYLICWCILFFSNSRGIPRFGTYIWRSDKKFEYRRRDSVVPLLGSGSACGIWMRLF